MTRSLAAATLMAFLLPLTAGCGGPAPDPDVRELPADAWAEDLRVLARELPRRHANAFHTVSAADFAAAVARLEAALPTLDADAAYIGMRRIVAMIGDGHTGLQSPPHWRPLPVVLRWFGDPVADPEGLEVRVTHAADAYSAALGARVLAIGDSSVAGAHRALSSLVARGESEGSHRLAIAWWLKMPPALAALGVAPSPDSVRFRVARDDGTEHELWLRPAPEGAPPLRRASEELPFALSRAGEPFWFARLPDAAGDSSVVYLRFDEYPPYLDFWRRSRALLAFADRHRAGTLVIDLRDNGGGDFNKVRRLLIPGLRRRAHLTGPDRLFVLTGPATFSAAMTNAVDFRQELGATLVGEPTGARPNQYQEVRSFRLPRSGLRVNYSIRYYRFQEEDTPGVLPDVHIVASWEDWLSGRDPVLEYALGRSEVAD